MAGMSSHGNRRAPRRLPVRWIVLFVVLLPAALTAATVTVQQAGVVLRSGPAADQEVVDKLAQWEILEVLEKRGDWYRVNRYGVQGWVSASLVSQPTGDLTNVRPEENTSEPKPPEPELEAPAEPNPLEDLPVAARDNVLRTSRGDVVVDAYEPGKEYIASIITARGTIVVQLWADAAPNHVKNFIHLSSSGYYDGLTFHRVVQDFLIQGGDPKGDGTGGPGYTIPLEASQRTHQSGVLSMARRIKDPNSGGSQFFILLGDYPLLDGKYTPFGRVVSGMDVARELGHAATNDWDRPEERLEILDVVVTERQTAESST